VLGVLDGGERQLVIADIPGLIEGASEGAGLGHDFLAHVERTRLLVHVLDIAPELSYGEGADALANYETIERELASHDPRLASLARVLALSKADLVEEDRRAREVLRWRERLGRGVPVIATSSATGLGVRELAEELLRIVPREPAPQAADESAHGPSGDAEEQLLEHMVFRPAGVSGYTVEALGPGSFAVRGRGVERLLARYDVDNDEAMSYLETRLRRIGVIAALEAKGFEPGDEIEIGGIVFELDPAEGPRRERRK
jgi:GTP-binding protein